MKKLYTIFSIIGLFAATNASAVVINIGQEGNSFAPNAINVNVGDVIHWIWTAGSHNTTSAVVPAGASSWAAPLNSMNPTFDYTVEIAGLYGYSCTFHAGMIGGFNAAAASSIEPVLTSSPSFVAGVDGNHILHLNIDNFNPTMTMIRLLDITGKEVDMLFNNQMATGEQSYQYELTGLTRGMYFVRLEQSAKVVTRKIMIN